MSGAFSRGAPAGTTRSSSLTERVHELSTENYLMRYDVRCRVSRLPTPATSVCWGSRKTTTREPSASRTGRAGTSPCSSGRSGKGESSASATAGFGLHVASQELPNYEMPPFDSIGANEYIVDVTHGAVDFISAVDTPALWELNIWYHTLNCGYRCRISGETDFPCIYGERVGLGRVYVKCPEGPLRFETWLQGLKDGRSYVSDGKSHLLDFQVGPVKVGEPGAGGEISQLELENPSRVRVSARIAALLDESPDPDLQARPLDHQPYWHLERARIDASRRVPLELVVNGEPVARQEILADGSLVPVQFEIDLKQSSWVALRIFPSSHTNPVFVQIGGRPIRASARSATWCLEAVDVCWKSKVEAIREDERPAAQAAYEHAREAYRRILQESAAQKDL